MTKCKEFISTLTQTDETDQGHKLVPHTVNIATKESTHLNDSHPIVSRLKRTVRRPIRYRNSDYIDPQNLPWSSDVTQRSGTC